MKFRFLLAKYTSKYEVSLYHYCLMSNHVHMLMRGSSANQGITQCMHGILTAYAIYAQKKYSLSGHIFENRFKHVHIDSDSYLLECGRYIECNPVRAGLVSHAADYEWSSYRHYALQRIDDAVTWNPLFFNLGPTAKERADRYRNYVETKRAYEELLDRYFDEKVLVTA